DFVVGAGGPQLGNVRAGVVGSLTTPSLSALGGGIATVVGAGLLALTFPALVRYDTREAGARAASTAGDSDDVSEAQRRAADPAG
ncbi:MAG TPA: hypothetical protein VFS29_00820, partial [Motilibacteraceae bacterium]|nr:hypothetical protein [Motilibacteraceae bacterium]